MAFLGLLSSWSSTPTGSESLAMMTNVRRVLCFGFEISTYQPRCLKVSNQGCALGGRGKLPLCSAQNLGYWACPKKDSVCRKRCLHRIPLFSWTRRTPCTPQTSLGAPPWDESLHLGDKHTIEAMPTVERRNIPLHWASTVAMSSVTWRNCQPV